MKTYLSFQNGAPVCQQGGVKPADAIELNATDTVAVQAAIASGKPIAFADGGYVIHEHDEAYHWSALRRQRSSLLQASDWTQVADSPVDAAAWAAYRQALRDLPGNTTDPTSPQWPDTP